MPSELFAGDPKSTSLPAGGSELRRRPAASRLLPPPRRMMDWSNLGGLPAWMIAERLLANDVADYVRFRAVCLPWRRISEDPRAQGILDRRFHPRRWIMLRETLADPDRRRRPRLLNVSTGQCVRAHLPELRGHHVCPATVEGLLVLLNTTTFAVRLLNPLTRQVSDFAPVTTVYPAHSPGATVATFTVSVAGLADDATVAVLFNGLDMLAVAKPGDEQWTLVEKGIRLWPATSSAGRFYCTTGWGIQMVDIRDNQPPRLVLAAKTAVWTDSRWLLDNAGELLLLTETSSGTLPQVWDFSATEPRYFMEYEVSWVDLDAGKTQPICDLGGRAVFIGPDRAISVSPSAFPAIKKNSVYLEKDYLPGFLVFTGPYTFVDGTTMSYYKVCDMIEDGGFDKVCGIIEDGGFDNCIPQYGPHSIVDTLSQYTSYSSPVAEENTSDSDAEDDTSYSCADAEEDTSDSDAEDDTSD